MTGAFRIETNVIFYMHLFAYNLYKLTVLDNTKILFTNQLLIIVEPYRTATVIKLVWGIKKMLQ